MTNSTISFQEAPYVYGAEVIAIYDADTWLVKIDLGMGMSKEKTVIRLYGVDAREIKRSKSKGYGDDHVEAGFDDRDFMISELGLDPQDFPRKVKYHELDTPIRIVLATIRDEGGKFGRLLGVAYKNNVNLNERLRDRLGEVQFYDQKTYPPGHPIIPPQLMSALT